MADNTGTGANPRECEDHARRLAEIEKRMLDNAAEAPRPGDLAGHEVRLFNIEERLRKLELASIRPAIIMNAITFIMCSATVALIGFMLKRFSDKFLGE